MIEVKRITSEDEADRLSAWARDVYEPSIDCGDPRGGRAGAPDRHRLRRAATDHYLVAAYEGDNPLGLIVVSTESGSIRWLYCHPERWAEAAEVLLWRAFEDRGELKGPDEGVGNEEIIEALDSMAPDRMKGRGSQGRSRRPAAGIPLRVEGDPTKGRNRPQGLHADDGGEGDR